jgi:hypothetical protein
VSPPWLEQLQIEWVDPLEFLDLWQPDWKKTFAPMNAAPPKWQRVWRNGIGLPRQGYCVRDKLLFKTGFYSDRLWVPCPKANLEILKKLHDSALAGHSGRHKTVARVQER